MQNIAKLVSGTRRAVITLAQRLVGGKSISTKLVRVKPAIMAAYIVKGRPETMKSDKARVVPNRKANLRADGCKIGVE